MHDLVLKNGLVVTPDAEIRGGIAIQGERIVAVGADANLGTAKHEIDLEGKIVLPGLFDPHIHRIYRELAAPVDQGEARPLIGEGGVPPAQHPAAVHHDLHVALGVARPDDLARV